jgi:hypothetical protein
MTPPLLLLTEHNVFYVPFTDRSARTKWSRKPCHHCRSSNPAYHTTAAASNLFTSASWRNNSPRAALGQYLLPGSNANASSFSLRISKGHRGWLPSPTAVDGELKRGLTFWLIVAWGRVPATPFARPCRHCEYRDVRLLRLRATVGLPHRKQAGQPDRAAREHRDERQPIVARLIDACTERRLSLPGQVE